MCDGVAKVTLIQLHRSVGVTAWEWKVSWVFISWEALAQTVPLGGLFFFFHNATIEGLCRGGIALMQAPRGIKVLYELEVGLTVAMPIRAVPPDMLLCFNDDI